MKFDVFVYNIPHNAWTYCRGYINAFQKMGLLNNAGDIHLWHNPANYPALFSGPANFIVMIGPEHHRSQIFGTPEKRAAIQTLKRQTGKKLIAICYESSVDPFGADSWQRAGYPWLANNLFRYGSRSSQCYSTNGLIEQFRCFDYVFTQDEIDMRFFQNNKIVSHWLPACCDIDVFKPMVERPVNRAGFIGNVWWPREDLVKFYPFKFDIMTVPKTSFDSPDALGMATSLAQAFGSFNIGVNLRSPFAGVSMRTFELMACGICPILYHPAPDRVLNRGVFGDWPHVAWFTEWSPDDSKKIAGYYTHMVANYEQTRQHGIENRKLICEKHTPVHRINTISKCL